MKLLTRSTQKQIIRLSAVLFVCCLAASFPAAARAQNAKINLDFLNKLASRASKSANVNLDQSMLQAAAASQAVKGNAKEEEMLQHLKGVYVRSFTFDKPGGYSHADVEEVLKQLRSGGWTNMVSTEKKGKTTAVYVMTEGGETIGMVVVAAKPEKFTVVNLVGPVDFGQLSGLDGVFNAVGMQHTSEPALKTRAH